MAKSESVATVGYVLRKFPVLSETFILNEILSLESRGVPIHIFALAPSRDPKFHEGVTRLRAPIVYVPGPADHRSLMRYVRAAASRYPRAFRREMLAVLARGRPKLLLRFLQAAYIAERAARVRIDRLHAHFANRSTTVARLASRISRIPYSFTAHAFDIYRTDVSPRVLRRKIDDANFVVTISESNQDLLEKVAAERRDKIRLLHNGIDLSAFRPAPTPTRPTFTILSVARLVEKKGLPYLIEACRHLRERGLDFQCWIVGRGNQRPKLARMITEERLDKIVKLRGAVRQGEVPDLYRSADLFVLPAIVASDGNREGLPVSIVEALACGLPVVSTPVSGITEVVLHEHNGVLVPQRNPWELTDVLHRLITNRPYYERLRANARPSVEDRFDIRRTSRSLEKLFTREVA
jgi:glycosyltransferase involved in cell wall biosynthesis